MVVVAGGVDALGDGDTEGGVSVSGKSHLEEILMHVTCVQMRCGNLLILIEISGIYKDCSPSTALLRQF